MSAKRHPVSGDLLFEMVKDLIEQIAIEARSSEYVDAKSGVSARLTISAYENLISAAERRKLLHGEKKVKVRIGDFVGVIPSITGKVELVYEGEQEGPYSVAIALISKAIKTEFLNHFPNPDKLSKGLLMANRPDANIPTNSFLLGSSISPPLVITYPHSW